MTATTRSRDKTSLLSVRSTTTVRTAKALGLTFMEARPQVQMVLLLRLAAGNLLGTPGGGLDIGAVLLRDGSWQLASWVVYLVNGLSDVKGDRRNLSPRPLASGRLTPRTAKISAISLAGLSLILTAADATSLMMVAGFLVLGAAYSLGPWPLKNWAVTASLTVGVAGFTTYMYGSLAARQDVSTKTVLAAVVLGSWMFVAGNAKDFGDEAGDLIAGRRTLPLMLGAATARRIVSAGVMTVGVAGTIASLRVPALLPLLLLLPAALAMTWLWRDVTNRREPRSGYRVFMWSQYGVNLALIGGCLLAR